MSSAESFGDWSKEGTCESDAFKVVVEEKGECCGESTSGPVEVEGGLTSGVASGGGETSRRVLRRRERMFRVIEDSEKGLRLFFEGRGDV